MSRLRVNRLRCRYGLSETKARLIVELFLEGRAVADDFRLKLKLKSGRWCIMARKGAGAATEAAWVTIGGCPSQNVAVRVWLALKARRGR